MKNSNKKHARLAPSAADRWMVCPGSVSLEEKLPPITTSSYAAHRGTLAHAVAEKVLTINEEEEGDVLTAYDIDFLDGEEIDYEMQGIVQKYVDYVQELHGIKFIERFVDTEIPDCYGTLDCISIDKSTFHIVDLKTGMVKIFANKNKQLMLYALGAYKRFQETHIITEIKLHVVQPSLDHIDVYAFPLEELLEFEKKAKLAAHRTKEQPHTYVASEKGCRFCRAKFLCPIFQNFTQKAIDAKDPNESLSYWLRVLPSLEEFVKNVKEESLRLLQDGRGITGFKLGEGRSSPRKWKDEDLFVQAAREYGIEHLIYNEITLKSPSQIIEILREEDIYIDLDDHIEVPSRKLVVVPDRSFNDEDI